MSYDITIGQAKRINDAPFGKVESVKTVRLENAPAYGEPTDHTNERWPAYLAWAQFVEYFKIPEYWLIQDHPGSVNVTHTLKKDIDKIYSIYKKQNPNNIAGFNIGNDYMLARLEWLKFWIDWSLDNCSDPVIYNT